MSDSTKPNTKPEYAKLLRTLREEKGVTQAQLAGAIGVTAGMVLLWERGTYVPGTKSALALSGYFGVDFERVIRPNSSRFAGELKRLRTQKGIYQTELADAVGVDVTIISRLETGERSPNFKTIRALSEFFGTDMRAFIDSEADPVSDDRSEIARKIKRARLEKGITQKQLAEAIGVMPPVIHTWESGKHTPRPYMLAALSEYFGWEPRC